MSYGGPREWQGPTRAATVRFTGKELDDDLGLYYFGARYHRAEIGRFTTVDPAQTIAENLVDPQRWNRYAYVRNNPLKFVDPDGRDALWVTYPGSRLVDVIIPVNISGSGATPELVAAIESRVNSLDTGNPEVRVILVVTDKPIAGVHNVLTLKDGPWLSKGEGCEGGGCVADGFGGRRGYVNTQRSDAVGVAAHEILHFAGAPEGYEKKTDANGKTVTPPAKGYTRRDIMADTSGSGTKLTGRDIDHIKANKTTRACSAGKDGKAVCK